MCPKLKDEVRKLVRGELKNLLDEFRQVRSFRLNEIGTDTTRKDYIAKRMDDARSNLDALKHLQRRDKAVCDRKKEIERDNAARNGKSGAG